MRVFPSRPGSGDRGRAAPGADQLGAILLAEIVALDQKERMKIHPAAFKPFEGMATA
jgi:hypothetical protein